MTDRDVYSLIERIIRESKSRINQGDRKIILQLLDAYHDSRNVIAAELMLLEDQIVLAVEAHRGDLTVAWMRRQDWYQRLDRTIQSESSRLEAKIRGLTIDGMALGISEGGVSGTSTANAISWAGLNPRPVEHWVAAIQPGSPLDKVLTRYGSNVESSLRNHITQGLIEGKGSTNIVREVLLDVGEVISPSDASRIVRTETMRAYRGVYRDQMDMLPKDSIAGYRWLAAIGDTRTCLQCLAMHNQVFPTYPEFQHVNCRCAVVPVFSPRYAPPQDFETGDEAFARRSADYQLQVLGPARYELYQQGMPLIDMVAIEHDSVWGGTTRLIPVKDLRP